jgi:hypothetical protein
MVDPSSLPIAGALVKRPNGLYIKLDEGVRGRVRT